MVKFILSTLSFVFLVSCIQSEDIGLKSDGYVEKEQFKPMEGPDLPHLGEAPELKNDIWLNTNDPLRLTELVDNVILLEMWTFG
jgi:hypothetical protein